MFLKKRGFYVIRVEYIIIKRKERCFIVDEFIKQNKGLVFYVIKKFYPSCINDEDVIQSGYIGLYLAAKNYDSNKGKFSTFAIRYIFNEIGAEITKRNKYNRLNSNISLDDSNPGNEFSEELLGEMEYGYDSIEVKCDLEMFSSTLTDSQKEILALAVIENKLPDEIAKLIGCSVSWIYRQLKVIKLKYEIFVREEF